MIRKIITAVFSFFMVLDSIACPVCEKKQPKVFSGITHGAGPDSKFDHWIIGVMVLITLYVLVCSVSLLLKPGEKHDAHIKRLIIKP